MGQASALRGTAVPGARRPLSASSLFPPPATASDRGGSRPGLAGFGGGPSVFDRPVASTNRRPAMSVAGASTRHGIGAFGARATQADGGSFLSSGRPGAAKSFTATFAPPAPPSSPPGSRGGPSFFRPPISGSVHVGSRTGRSSTLAMPAGAAKTLSVFDSVGASRRRRSASESRKASMLNFDALTTGFKV